MQLVKDAIQNGATDLSPYSAILRETITIDQLNSGEHLNSLPALGLRAVKSNTMFIGFSLQFLYLGYVAELFIGLTDSAGNVDALATPKTTSYNKQPGLSIAIRYRVVVNLFDKDIVTSTGLTQWHVSQLADFSGFLTGQGGSGDSGKTWTGTQAEYEAITEKDPDTIYFITES